MLKVFICVTTFVHDCQWFVDKNKILNCQYDLADKVQDRKLSYYAIFNANADICDEPP